MSRPRIHPVAAVVGGVLLIGVVLLVLKWLLITVAILIVPFGVWWIVDHHRAAAPGLAGAGFAGGSAPPAPAPPDSRRWTPAGHHPPRTTPRATPSVSGPRPPLAHPTGRTASRLLAAERNVTVTRDEDHQDVLGRHHRPAGAHVVAELCSSTVSRGRHRGAYAVEVRLDGRRVGELTGAMSERYRRPVVEAEAQGPSARCEGRVTHGERGFQIELRLPDPR